MKQLKNKFSKVRSKLPSATPETPPPGRITNDTVAQHREQILSAGRRFKYPLQHSKQRIIFTSIGIVVAALLLFGSICWWQLYKAQSTGVFMYRVVGIVPAPVARIDGTSVRYSDYLLQLRSNMHYLSTQEGVNFKTEDGKRQLDNLKSRALAQVMQYTLIKKLAKQYHVSVTNHDVDTQVQQILSQQSYASSLDVYKKVLKTEYDKTYSQWRNDLELQIMRNRVYDAMDTSARARADAALKELNGGVDFATVAKKYTDDPTQRNSGGEIGVLEKGKADLPIELQNSLFSLKAGQHSGIIESKQGLFIMEPIEVNGSKVRAAAIYFKYTAFNTYITNLQKDNKVSTKIKVSLPPLAADQE
jgi:hypothetical protein